MAWESIAKDDRLQQQLTQAQAADSKEKTKNNNDARCEPSRGAWSHILYPVKSSTPGQPFDLEHDPITSRERAAIPSSVYDKIKADGIVPERLGRRISGPILEPYLARRPSTPRCG